mgnify:CR=1 FL=1
MLLSIIYLIAISAEAMTGALSAGRRRMDLFGVVMIACVTALGGGSLRDILLGHYPLGWVKHPEYLGFTVCAALIATWVARWMHHFRRTFLVLDGLGLICFTLIGCAVARDAGHAAPIVLISDSQDLLMRSRLTNSINVRPVACLNTREKYVGFIPRYSATSSSGNSRA